MSIAGNSIDLTEPRCDQGFERLDGLDGLRSGRLDHDRRARAGGEHHQPHDRGSADGLAMAGHRDVGVEFFRRLHESRRSARMQTTAIDDLQHPRDRRGGVAGRPAVISSWRLAHFPASTRLAMVMYLRPASCAWTTASASGLSSRTLASFTSMGRLRPARTSTIGRFITEIERFEGVPPNMSVRMATPSPVSTRLTASMMS